MSPRPEWAPDPQRAGGSVLHQPLWTLEFWVRFPKREEPGKTLRGTRYCVKVPGSSVMGGTLSATLVHTSLGFLPRAPCKAATPCFTPKKARRAGVGTPLSALICSGHVFEVHAKSMHLKTFDVQVESETVRYSGRAQQRRSWRLEDINHNVTR